MVCMCGVEALGVCITLSAPSAVFCCCFYLFLHFVVIVVVIFASATLT